MDILDKIIKNSFDSIHAEEERKERTLAYIRSEGNKKQLKNKRMFAVTHSLCACAAIFVLFLTARYYVYSPAVYISIDVNPSIEVTLNRMNRVIAVQAYNEEASRILSLLKLQNSGYKDAIAQILSQEEAKGYLTEENYLLLTVETGNKAKKEKLLRDLNSYVTEYLMSHRHSIQAEYIEADLSERLAAHSHGLSMGKYLTVMELLSLDEEADFNSCAGMTVQELKTEISHCHGKQSKVKGTAPSKGHHKNDGHHH